MSGGKVKSEVRRSVAFVWIICGKAVEWKREGQALCRFRVDWLWKTT